MSTARAPWLPDKSANKCPLCPYSFGFCDRHHCRKCGRVVCDACSTARLANISGYDKAERACTECVLGHLEQGAALFEPTYKIVHEPRDNLASLVLLCFSPALWVLDAVARGATPEGKKVLTTTPFRPDSDVTQCKCCALRFGMMCRKHHCRKCGDVVCDSCSTQRLKIPGYIEAQRMCDACAAPKMMIAGPATLPFPAEVVSKKTTPIPPTRSLQKIAGPAACTAAGARDADALVSILFFFFTFGMGPFLLFFICLFKKKQ